MDYQLLLLEDVRKTGRKGDVVKAKSGFARNFLIPQKKAVIADKRTLRMQARLKEERDKQAVIDKADSEKVAQEISGFVCSIEVKVDAVGHMYGSVTANDIVKVLAEKGVQIEKGFVHLPHPIKKLGEYRIVLNLKEGVAGSFLLNVNPDREIEVPVKTPAKEASVEPEAPAEEQTEEE